MSYRTFCYEIAKELGSSGGGGELVEMCRRLDYYVPPSLLDDLDKLFSGVQTQIPNLTGQLQKTRDAMASAVSEFKDGSNVSGNRSDIKRELWSRDSDLAREFLSSSAS